MRRSIKARVEQPADALETTLTVYCAACAKLLGTITAEGWTWHCGAPGRLVNRRRLITDLAVGTEPPASPPDNFRMRTVQRDRTRKDEYTVWEYPYTCDADECMDALGPEWETPTQRDADPRFKVMPPGKVLS